MSRKQSPRELVVIFEPDRYGDRYDKDQVVVIFPVPRVGQGTRGKLVDLDGIALERSEEADGHEYWLFPASRMDEVMGVVIATYPRWTIEPRCTECGAVTPTSYRRATSGRLVQLCERCDAAYTGGQG